MADIRRGALVENRDILLFDILEELKKINSRKEEPRKEHIESKKENEGQKKVYNCKYCGGTHEQPWQIARCGKEKKQREGVK